MLGTFTVRSRGLVLVWLVRACAVGFVSMMFCPVMMVVPPVKLGCVGTVTGRKAK